MDLGVCSDLVSHACTLSRSCVLGSSTILSLWPCRHSETSAWLSAVLTSANLLLIFVLQKLASVLSDREQMRVSQGALLKQVDSLQAQNGSSNPWTEEWPFGNY